MPDKDLERYMAKIDMITYALNGASPDELRVEIYNMFIDLLKYYTGNDSQKSLSKQVNSAGIGACIRLACTVLLGIRDDSSPIRKHILLIY